MGAEDPGGSIFLPDRVTVDMVNVPAAGAVVLVLLLFGIALLAMSSGDFRVAGFCFLSAMVVIYFRETRLVDT